MTLACERCSTPGPLANLTLVGGDLICPSCLYLDADAAWRHQRPIPRPNPEPAHGLEVVNIPRGMDARRAMRLARRESGR
jgi:hypothetical protein